MSFKEKPMLQWVLSLLPPEVVIIVDHVLGLITQPFKGGARFPGSYVSPSLISEDLIHAI
jgi:hypothetical protein